MKWMGMHYKHMLYMILVLWCYGPAHAYTDPSTLLVLEKLSALPQEPLTQLFKQQKKAWTIIIYMAADNDLRGFAARNIKQMSAIGSNMFINIVVHLDIKISGNKKITRRYVIEQNKIMHLNQNDPDSQAMDSGNPLTLISFCKWAIGHFPADHYALIFWNHGSGIIDPDYRRRISMADLFVYNPLINKLELDRSIGFIDLIEQPERDDKGVCFDDTSGKYLTNQKLDQALSEICKTMLNNSKFDLIGFDTCLMAMLEVGNIVKKYAKIMVGSQEVELGAGWNYTEALAPFAQNSIDAITFARTIVEAYARTYQKITNDYTQSAINLERIDELETKIHEIAQLLIECLAQQRDATVKLAIRTSRNKLLCTHFDEPSYVDADHFLHNLYNNSKLFEFNNPALGQQLTTKLLQAITTMRTLLKEIIFANRVGANLAQARGLSIYFPERKIHTSYRKTSFAATNAWSTFITQYLLS